MTEFIEVTSGLSWRIPLTCKCEHCGEEVDLSSIASRPQVTKRWTTEPKKKYVKPKAKKKETVQVESDNKGEFLL